MAIAFLGFFNLNFLHSILNDGLSMKNKSAKKGGKKEKKREKGKKETNTQTNKQTKKWYLLRKKIRPGLDAALGRT